MTGPSMIRTRWAAVGAAVAVAVGAGGIGLVGATSPDGAAAFVAITPCRIADTRPDFQVGERSAPLGANDTHQIAATGESGECDLPNSATGVVLNITAIDASLPTFLTVFPAGAERPNASSLNPVPGQPPTPNAVTTDLDADGRFALYNLQGTVHVIADVVGYYTDHSHDDRYYTKSQTDAAIADSSTVVNDPTEAAIAAAVDTAVERATDAIHEELAPRSPLVLGFADVVHAGAGWNGQNAWVSDGPGSGCLVFAADLPAGALVTGVTVSYEAPADAAVGGMVGGIPVGPGSYDAYPTVVNFYSSNDTVVPATAANTIGAAPLTASPAPGVTTGPAADDLSSILAFCAADPITIYGASIEFTLP